ncbi:hypothetical protein ZOSMA_16G01460 [Zostera marina]|uniref:Rad21/Rec8-like protein N-terminal domain-containing protein n=1 Tax=Zostera marina TaxID=29655 RepID=A0A0K9PVD4_ZOSMR|nr:hypothetical protein ZOSMA_16G01460 [Zostera marina]
MFYSHQLLARKAPLGQIWMAATLHAKFNRRKLDKINIIKICEEILNPSVPMALRLSGILMGTMLLHCQRARWRTLISRYPMTNATASARTRFRNQNSRMQLDELEDEYIQINYNDSSQSLYEHHQADPQNITIVDEMDSFLPTENDLYNRFETFGTFGDDEELLFTQDQRKDGFTINSTPPFQTDNELVPDHHTDEPEKDQMVNETNREAQDAQKDEQRQGIGPRRATRKVNNLIMDNDHLILSGSVYQSWLLDTRNILRKRRRKIKQPNPILAGKIANIMEIPPTILHSFIESFPNEICYPAPLMEQWIEITKPDINSSSSLPENNMRDLNFNKGSILNSGNSGESTLGASNPMSRSGTSKLPMFSSGRSLKKKQHPSSRNSLDNFDPLEEDFTTLLESVPEDTYFEFHEETGPTQMPHGVAMDTPTDAVTQQMKTHFKTHFTTEDAPLSESLDNLSSGMNRRNAARLFYQICGEPRLKIAKFRPLDLTSTIKKIISFLSSGCHEV